MRWANPVLVGVLGLAATVSGGLTISVVDGVLDGRFIGTYTSQIAATVLPMFPPVDPDEWVRFSTYNRAPR